MPRWSPAFKPSACLRLTRNGDWSPGRSPMSRKRRKLADYSRKRICLARRPCSPATRSSLAAQKQPGIRKAGRAPSTLIGGTRDHRLAFLPLFWRHDHVFPTADLAQDHGLGDVPPRLVELYLAEEGLELGLSQRVANLGRIKRLSAHNGIGEDLN